MRVLVAPQEFKGSLTAEEAADAIAGGVREAHPSWTIDLVPLSDGGPGFLDALRRSVRADTGATLVHDPLGRPVLARYLVIRRSGHVVVEAAQANGLMHVAPGERDALRADTRGVGELLLAACGPGAARLTVGVGGSATSDGGAGMAAALGARLLDPANRDLGPGVEPLLSLARIDWARPERFASLVEVTVATDVANPLVGPEGAGPVYGPQKGATPAMAAVIDRALRRYAEVVERDLGIRVADRPGAGAAGGLAAGLVAFLGARIESGFDVVADATGLEARLSAADVVLTGEGRFDSQTLQGKGPARLAAMASAQGRRAVIFAGSATAGPPAGSELCLLSEVEPSPEAAMANAATVLRERARRWAAES